MAQRRIVLVLFLLSLASTFAGARDSKFTRKGTGPMYWIAYEYCFESNVPISEYRWQRNIDWMAENFRDYGYDMICNDGWIEGAQTINANGYVTKYNSGWEHGFDYWGKYIADKGMIMGIYYNPLWMTKKAFKENCQILGSDKTTQEIAGHHSFNGELHWVDVDKEGAEQWVKGYVRYFINLGAKYLRIDFLENYENNYGTARYAKALKWMMEEAGDEIFLSLVMPNCFNHAKTELVYGDMIRVDDDCFKGTWDFVSARRRGQRKANWPQYGNLFDGMVAFSDVAAKGQMVLDGDFMRLNTMASVDEMRFKFSIMVMGGSALTIADQFDTITEEAAEVYKNEELIALNKAGFVARPLSINIADKNSSRWVGQLPDGDIVVGLFNREEETMTYSIDFSKELGIKSAKAKNIRDLWAHKDLGSKRDSYSVNLAPHSCKVIRITPDGKVRRYQAESASLRGGAVVAND